MRNLIKPRTAPPGHPAWLNILIALATGLAAHIAPAQTSSDACTNAAANRYPVNGTCTPVAFNKPATFVYNYNPGGCGSGNRQDAFGSFIATSTQTTVQYTPSGGANAILQVMASCTGPLLGCADNNGNNGTETVTIPTVPGTTYYVRIQRTSNYANAMNGTLCVYNTACLYTLHLYDSFGDGWTVGTTATVEIRVNGISIGVFTLATGYEGLVDFGINNGDAVQVIYSSGSYNSENSVGLTVAGKCAYHSPNGPATGTLFNGTVNCTPLPPSLPQDCGGGITVCSSQNINNTSNNPGCFSDLNASNQGCLAQGERQGTWYYLSPSSSGTLGFTLTPAGNDDYDFALWGPFDDAVCPTGPPARCSYFDNAYYSSYTGGMGNGATDFSEGPYRPPILGGLATNDGWVAPLSVVAGKVYVLYIDNYSVSGQSFNLAWSLSGGSSLDCTVLPVELLSLEATAQHQAIMVDWATATERNAAFFEVQRSADSREFHTVGSVPATGDAQYRNDYQFVDEHPLQGANYYRLNQVDRDGRSEITQTVVAYLGLDPGAKPVLFPNPADDLLNVAFTSPVDGDALVLVKDALGRTVQEELIAVKRGEPAATLSTGRLAKGWYSLSVVLPDGAPLMSAGFLKR